MERRGQRGQASVEHIAIVIVVAILLGAVGTWIAAHARADHPPPIVERVVAPVEPRYGAQREVPDLGVAPPSRRGNRIVGGLRRVAGVVRKSPRFAVRGVRAYAGGVAHGIGSAVGGLVRDPVGSVMGGASVLQPLLSDPVGFTRAQVEAGRAYLRRLRTLPPEDAYEAVMRDLGDLTADVAIARGKKAAAKAAYRALRRRPETRPPDRGNGAAEVSR
jgi:hypothetical protein